MRIAPTTRRRAGVRPPILLAVMLAAGRPADTLAPPAPPPADAGWIELIGPNTRDLSAWQTPPTGWRVVGGVQADPADPARLSTDAGAGVLTNTRPGLSRNLLSRDEYGDVEIHAEFCIPRGSNTGIKCAGLYEVQIIDSFGAAGLSASQTCGGIYPRADLLPRYHYLDAGQPPLVNAALAPGTWQSLEIRFQAPRFDATGRKTANARFVRVTLNGRVVQQDRELATPTGHAWRNPEHATGPLLLQGDHGPAAFRNLRLRPLR